MSVTNIFLTGATGFVGSNLAYRFLKHGHNLKLLVRSNDSSARDRIKCLLSSSSSEEQAEELIKTRVEVIEGDITKRNLGISPSLYRGLLKVVDEIWHCAASVKFDERNRETLEAQNIIGTKNILAFSQNSGVRCLHHVSTAYVAGNSRGIVREDELNHEQGFKNPYEESKYAAEKLVKESMERGRLRAIIYRPSIIVGDSITCKTTSITSIYAVARTLDSIIRRVGRKSETGGLIDRVRIPGSENADLNLVPIDYVVNAVIAVSQQEGNVGKTFHIVNPSPPSLSEVCEGISEALDIKLEIANANAFKKEPMILQERLFKRNIRLYIPYLSDQIIFDETNTRDALGRTSIKCPGINKDTIAKLINYCYVAGWSVI